MWDLWNLITFGAFEKKPKKESSLSNSTESRNHSDMYPNKTMESNSSNSTNSSSKTTEVIVEPSQNQEQQQSVSDQAKQSPVGPITSGSN